MKQETWQVSLESLPVDLEAMLALSAAELKNPADTVLLTIAALALWETDEAAAFAMIEYLKGPGDFSTYEKQFIKERLSGRGYLPFSYFKGATPENNYEPEQPYQLTVLAMPDSFAELGYAQLYVQSGGADSPRPIKLRQKLSSGQWFLADQMLLAQIRVPVAADPWA